MSFIQNTLSKNSFWIVNKAIAKEVGVDAAILLSELIGREIYIEHKLEIDGEEYFHATSDSLEASTSLSYKIQRRCIGDLKKALFIKTKLKGIPAKQHFTICESEIESFIRTSSALKSKLLYNNNSIIIDNNKEEREKNSKMSQGDLFGVKIPRGKHLFSESPFSDFKNFEKSLQKEAELGIDLRFYFGAVSDWSASGNNKKTDWPATARGFMRRDKQDDKLVFLNSKQNVKTDAHAMQKFITGKR